MFEQADKGAKEGVPNDKAPGPIDRIENPCVMGVRDATVFLTHHVMAWIFFPDAAPEHHLDFPIRYGYRSIIGLEKDVRRSSKIPQCDGTGCISKAVCKRDGTFA